MSLNKVMLIGRLGRDPEVRYMPSGEAVCNFSLATSESWNDKKSGNRVERTEWHNISMYGRLAEIAGQYLKKGGQVYIEGRIQSRKYTDKQGMERTAYDIVANEMKMLGSKNDNSHSDNADGWDDGAYSSHSYAAPKAEVADAPPPSAPQKRSAPVAPTVPVEDIDEDIPF
ncbi:single-stranded DNA-binding protein [Simonsiella muelleri]|uniref:Single-stranded DNA-binding protein n=1 Tax=Simonsiella muelleri ATCC 29453 TaxID=641147 RepID=V9HC19_9NEIS|nr:single-stranded DNA-binding protein [Simonsiella muelleri]AUX61560.1 single-stranded DNA-binding protein [Simonsiella muelleri ATCC 29453]EFG30793.1 single-strand binding protein [Simonsiella muelleri ATCC 29453]UBQ53620.1 single-stranded DNA-binding protein [Simonsiella muelleri]